METTPKARPVTQTGTVRFYNESKGFGMITPDTGGGDLFAHSEQIRIPGLKKLRPAQHVTFELEDRPEGRMAMNIRLA